MCDDKSVTILFSKRHRKWMCVYVGNVWGDIGLYGATNLTNTYIFQCFPLCFDRNIRLECVLFILVEATPPPNLHHSLPVTNLIELPQISHVFADWQRSIFLDDA